MKSNGIPVQLAHALKAGLRPSENLALAQKDDGKYSGVSFSNPIGSMYGIFTYMWLKSMMIKVGKYTSPMDPMGMSHLQVSRCARLL